MRSTGGPSKNTPPHIGGGRFGVATGFAAVCGQFTTQFDLAAQVVEQNVEDTAICDLAAGGRLLGIAHWPH